MLLLWGPKLRSLIWPAFAAAALSTLTAAAHVKCHGSEFVPDDILRITAQNVSMSCESRYSTVVNGTIPGPPLRIPAGQTSWIRVHNDATDQNLTVHWHGLSQAVAPFSDGTPQTSQWPIPPGHYFDYELHPGNDTAGTYFYHSHVGLQALTAHGALIVEDIGAPPYQYDEERLVIFTDYFNNTDGPLIQGLTANPFTWTGEVNGVLVNGFGTNNTANASIPRCSLGQINVEPDKTYRLRFIGATGLSFISLKFQGHNSMQVIEADGHYTKPYETNYLQIGSGQRYDVLLKTKTTQELAADRKAGLKNYLMQFKTLERPYSYLAYAVLKYPGQTTPIDSAPSTAPMTLPDTTLGFLDDLAPLVDPDMPPDSAVNRTVVLNVISLNRSLTTNDLDATPQYIWTVDKHTPWTAQYPAAPYLVSLYEDHVKALPNYTYALQNGGFDDHVRAFPGKIGEVIDIVMQARGLGIHSEPDVHPFHIHGRHVYNLGSGNGTYNATANAARLAALGHPPALRDSTMLFRPWLDAPHNVPAGWRAWRLQVTEAGAWMLHCHTLAHMMMGMQTVWVLGDEADILKVPKPLVEGYLSYGGGAYGNVSYDACPVHYNDS